MVSMKKLLVLILVVSCMFLFSACASFRSGELSKTKDEQETIRNVADTIINAFTEKKQDAIENILSNVALKTSDLNEGFDYCCSLLDEEIAEIEQKGCPVSGHIEAGKSSKKSDASFNITMTSGTIYNLYFEYWFENELDSSKLGVNRIEIIDYNVAINDPNFDPDKFSECSGIYNPDWDTE